MSDLLITFFGATILYLFASSRLELFVKTLGLQGILLFALILTDLREIDWPNILFWGLETIVLKAFVIPFFLLRAIRRHEIVRDASPDMPRLHALFTATIIFVFGIVAAHWAAGKAIIAQPLYFGVSLSVIVASLYLIVRRKRIVTHILCYMLLENGIFLLSIAAAQEMPLIINMGMLLDLFVAVYLLIIFLNLIRSLYDADHIDILTKLKD